jgi:hypothetical protein
MEKKNNNAVTNRVTTIVQINVGVSEIPNINSVKRDVILPGKYSKIPFSNPPNIENTI